MDAKDLGLSIAPTNAPELERLGREIKALVRDGALGIPLAHEDYGIVLYEELEKTNDTLKERNVTVFADGQVDRSPCRSGTSARLAIHFTNGKIRVGHGKLLNHSVIGTMFEEDLMPGDQVVIGGYPTCISRVREKANLIGRMKFFIDSADPVYPGFLLQ